MQYHIEAVFGLFIMLYTDLAVGKQLSYNGKCSYLQLAIIASLTLLTKLDLKKILIKIYYGICISERVLYIWIFDLGHCLQQRPHILLGLRWEHCLLIHRLERIPRNTEVRRKYDIIVVRNIISDRCNMRRQSFYLERKPILWQKFYLQHFFRLLFSYSIKR